MHSNTKPVKPVTNIVTARMAMAVPGARPEATTSCDMERSSEQRRDEERQADLTGRDDRGRAHVVVLVLDVTPLHEHVGEDFLKGHEEQDPPQGVDAERAQARLPAEERSRDAGPEDDAQGEKHTRDGDA